MYIYTHQKHKSVSPLLSLRRDGETIKCPSLMRVRNNTELSKHIWQLKDQKKDFTISWKILTKAKSYANLTKQCNLCNIEKFCILFKPDMATLNKRNEIYQLVGIRGSCSLNSVASLRTNHKFTYKYCFTFEYCNGLDYVADVYI